jgi:hypothetical protein
MYKIIIIFVTILFSGLKLFAQASEFPKIMYIISEEGLWIRTEPSLNSNKIGIFLYGERIRVYEKNNMPVTIDGITSHWYKTSGKFYEGKWYNSAWVFGGYLSEQFPDDAPVILGYWDVVDKSRNYYFFSADQTYLENGI